MFSLEYFKTDGSCFLFISYVVRRMFEKRTYKTQIKGWNVKRTKTTTVD